MKKRLTIFILDDEPLIRWGLQSLFNAEPDFEVIGESGDAFAAIELTNTLKPDVVLMDLQLAGCNGIEVLRAIRREQPQIRVLLLSATKDESSISESIKCGASGFLLKHDAMPGIVASVRAAHCGHFQISMELAESLIVQRSLGEFRSKSDLNEFTPREREVLHMIGLGYANKRIATELKLSEKTVKVHVGRILSHLHLTNRTEAALWLQNN